MAAHGCFLHNLPCLALATLATDCQVVRQPVVVAGNSIGGFISANMAADNVDLVKGLALLNSAGPIEPGFTLEQWRQAAAAKKPPPALVVKAVSQLLFLYLELTIKSTLKRLYPTNPAAADEWLADEIYRAACDGGALAVFRAGAYLPPPRALNFLVKDVFRGPTVVLQGVLDPLNDARGRAEQLGRLCPDNVSVVLLNASHCPHDEAPQLVNKGLLDFIAAKVLTTAAAPAGHSASAASVGAAASQ